MDETEIEAQLMLEAQRLRELVAIEVDVFREETIRERGLL